MTSGPSINSRLLVAAWLIGILSWVASIGYAFWLNDNRNRELCESQRENRAILTALVDLTKPSDFYERAKPIVDRPLKCEEGT